VTRLKGVVALVGTGLLLAAVIMDVTLGMPVGSRVVGWVAIVVLFGAVAIRLKERRRDDEKDDD
jgi:hypothetical protein